MNTEQLFLDTIQEMRERLAKGDRYSLIKASGLLRLLFIDAAPLWAQVNRAYRVKIQFVTIDFTMQLPEFARKHVWLHWQNISTDGFPGARTITVSLDKFLGAPIVTFSGHTFSVRDVIISAAHYQGGVHHGTPKEERDKVLLDLDKTVLANDAGVSIAALRGVIQVALRGLEPLTQSVIAGRTQTAEGTP